MDSVPDKLIHTKALISLLLIFTIGCSSFHASAQETLNYIFSTKYETYIISKGDNIPDFDRRKDSILLYLVALNEKIEPKDFQVKAGWSDEKLNRITQLLIGKGWLIKDSTGLKPSVFIVSDQQGKKLLEYAMPLAEKIAASIEKEIPSIKDKYNFSGFAAMHNFDSLAFFILSDVLLDNWQIMEMEATYLKKENRPQRHGKFYYASVEENANNSYEPFGIYGNQYGQINDSTYLSIYGNNRLIVKNRLKNDKAFTDSIIKVSFRVTTELSVFFNEIAREYKPKLIEILNENTGFSHQIYEKTGYSKEIAFEEFFIWWYHFIYTEATNILSKKNKLTIPKDGNFYYR